MRTLLRLGRFRRSRRTDGVHANRPKALLGDQRDSDAHQPRIGKVLAGRHEGRVINLLNWQRSSRPQRKGQGCQRAEVRNTDGRSCVGAESAARGKSMPLAAGDFNLLMIWSKKTKRKSKRIGGITARPSTKGRGGSAIGLSLCDPATEEFSSRKTPAAAFFVSLTGSDAVASVRVQRRIRPALAPICRQDHPRGR